MMRVLSQLPEDAAIVARRLREFSGFVWLDSSDGSERWGGCLLAVEPVDLRRGCLPEEFPEEAPDGALWIGSIDYSGQWTFGLYTWWLRLRPGGGGWEGSAQLAERVFHAKDAPEALRQVRMRPENGQEDYVARVHAAQEYIRSGDIYQVNIARKYRFSMKDPAHCWGAYLALRQSSPAPHGAFIDLGGRTIMCNSPETFLDLEGTRMLTRPIKGTRPRGNDAQEDGRLLDELLASSKERAELVMITDLERNDFGKVAETGSVQVESLCRRESFAHVHHLVSQVTGRLARDCDQRDLLRACFPGGSITGAPKCRAMELIREIEGFDRELYTGAIGWTDGARRACFNIAIRTAWVDGEKGVFCTGSGIVADSRPVEEYQETLHKARGLSEALAMVPGVGE